MEDGTPFVSLGNSEPIPEWMLDPERIDLGPILQAVRAGRRKAGWCDHGLRLASAGARRFTDTICPEGCS